MTITLKMHDFHVSKVSGANGVLDIYIDTPKSSKKSSNPSVSDYYGSYIILLRYIKPNIFGPKPSFQTKYFRWNTDFSKVLFSVKRRVFKPNIFGDAGSFPEYTSVLLIAECNPCNVDFIHESVMFITVLCQINTVFSSFASL